MSPEHLFAAIVGVPIAGLALGIAALSWRGRNAGRPAPKPLHDMDIDELESLHARLSDPDRLARASDPEALRAHLVLIGHHVADRRRRAALDAALAEGTRAQMRSPSEMGETWPSSAWMPSRDWAVKPKWLPESRAEVPSRCNSNP